MLLSAISDNIFKLINNPTIVTSKKHTILNAFINFNNNLDVCSNHNAKPCFQMHIEQ